MTENPYDYPKTKFTQSSQRAAGNNLGIGTLVFGLACWITSYFLLRGPDPSYAVELVSILCLGCVALSLRVFVVAIQKRVPLRILCIIPAVSFTIGIWRW